MRIIDLMVPGEEIFTTIRRISNCERIAEAMISTSSFKSVYVTDNGRVFTLGRYANKESLTEVKAGVRYNRKVFLFVKATTTRSIFGAAELIYCSFNKMDYEDMGRCSFRDGDPMNIHLSNLVYERIEDNVHFADITSFYKSEYKRLVGLIRYIFPKIAFEDCRDIVSDTFLYLSIKLSRDTQKNDIDFPSVWLFWAKKYALSRYLYKNNSTLFGEWMYRDYQNTDWDIYRLIDRYIPDRHKKVAGMIARGYSNRDISEELGLSIVESNMRRSNIMRTFRNKLTK